MMPLAIELTKQGWSTMVIERTLTWPDVDRSVGTMRAVVICAEQWLSKHAIVTPKDFACAIFFDVDPPIHDGIDIASVVGGEGNFPQTPPAPVIREVSLILDGTLYTAVYDPPLKRDEKFSGLRRNVGIPARVDGDALFVKWPDGKEVKAKIIRRERINPNQPQPA